jgi:hypothetical protein
MIVQANLVWMTRFIENYVVANKRLPTGKHRIQVQFGGSSSASARHLQEAA